MADNKTTDADIPEIEDFRRDRCSRGHLEPENGMSGSQSTEGTHIRFVAYGIRPGQKTERWGVETKEDEDLLGEVKWFGRWRQYAFFPAPECVFEQICMREISDFIEEVMRARKAAA